MTPADVATWMCAGTAAMVATRLALRAGPPGRPVAPSSQPTSGVRRRASFVRPTVRVRRLDAALPDVLDLLVVGLQAGLPVGAIFAHVAGIAPPAARPGLHDLVARLERGDRVVDALPVLVDHWGSRALALVAAVSAAEVAGLPLAPTLDRIADDARAHRRRVAEAEARRLPVRLAVPLVCCTLPSFVCIAIGPLIVGALSSLRSV